MIILPYWIAQQKQANFVGASTVSGSHMTWAS
jgi:hypothetical protein